MFRAITFDTVKEYDEWLIAVQQNADVDIVSVLEFKGSLVVTVLVIPLYEHQKRVMRGM